MKRRSLFARSLFSALLVTGVVAFLAPSSSVQAEHVKGPQFLANNEVAIPDNYREWIFVSSGLGMSYGPLARAEADNPPFDNVFVTPEAYRSFLKTGQWPDGTMFVMEVRRSKSRESINDSGHFQGDSLGMEAEVKDSIRFPGKWGFYAFTTAGKAGKLLPAATTDCQACHSAHGAVDNTFVQFYPTLFEVAKKKGTVKSNY